jgi:lipopolysaccharide/colanic/teichoic acid biosynthesis glycosyltransferase
MPGSPLYRLPQALSLCDSSLGDALRQERIELTGSPSHVWPLLFPRRESIALVPEIIRSEQAETAIDPGSRIASEPALLLNTGLILKRVVDFSLSAVALLLLWPFLLVIALAIKLESPGQAIYASLRARKKGQTFSCYKFRTMFEGADKWKDSLRKFNERRDPFFKIADDPRITRLGCFLRKYSLDELPQFWNVLKGNMSLVGPRPHPLDDYARYRPEDHRRLDVKPGITGLWQVMARTNPSFEICMKLDLEYMKSWNLLLDLKILMRTVPAVLSGDGQ